MNLSGIALLARRSLELRPGRTVLFLAGFALAVAVMIALLSVGEAIVEQARDKDLVGGGDIVLVPQGVDVEVLKLGGVSAMWSTIPNARFLARQLLAGPRFSPDVAAASPSWAGRPLYLRRGDRVAQGVASASIPALERAIGNASLPASWRDTPGELAFARLEGPELYDEMDRWHLPAAGHPDASRWAEWMYFNLLDPASGRYAYLSYFVAGDVRAGKAMGSLSLQWGAPGGRVARFATAAAIDSTALDLEGANVRFGDFAHVAQRGGRYALFGRYRDAVTGAPVEIDLEVVPEPRAYLPAAVMKGSDGFESGYAVPAALGRARGTIAIGGERHELTGAIAYHDHNWGYWKSVRWDWGQTQSTDGSIALVYGAVHAPELDRSGGGGRAFAFVMAKDGLLGAFMPDPPTYESWRGGPRVEGANARTIAPGTIRFAKSTADDTLEVLVRVTDVAASLPAGDPRASEGPRLGAGRAFLQMRGTYEVRGRVGGRAIAFSAPGSAETFVELGAAR
jgi:hypothetical protein